MSAVMERSAAARAAWEGTRDKIRARWRAFGLRERRTIGIGGSVLVVFLLWSLAVQPAWRTLRDTPAQIDQLDAQLQQMRRMAAESRELRGAPVVGSAQSAAALRAATDRLGDHGRLQLIGDRATLTLIGATGEELRRWLAEVRSGARVRPIEAALTRAAQGYNGTLVVNLPAGGAP
jgi:general secretion pathway protein M